MLLFMPRVFGLALIVLAFCTTTAAQIRYQMGVTAGINYSSLRSGLFTTSSGRPAPVAGFSFVVSWSDYLELNQEVVLTFRGAQARAVYFLPEQRPEEHTYAYHYNSFETAVFAGLRPGAKIPIYLQIGGYFGANFHNLNRTRRDLMVLDYENINNALRAVDLNDAFAGIDVGPALGLSAGEGRFRANFRYYLGLRNLYKSLDFVAPGPRIRTNALRFSLTYFFR